MGKVLILRPKTVKPQGQNGLFPVSSMSLLKICLEIGSLDSATRVGPDTRQCQIKAGIAELTGKKNNPVVDLLLVLWVRLGFID